MRKWLRNLIIPMSWKKVGRKNGWGFFENQITGERKLILLSDSNTINPLTSMHNEWICRKVDFASIKVKFPAGG